MWKSSYNFCTGDGHPERNPIIALISKLMIFFALLFVSNSCMASSIHCKITVSVMDLQFGSCGLELHFCIFF